MKIQFQDINLEVVPDKSHEWLLDSAMVADGYGITESALRKQKGRNAEDLIEGKHWVGQNVPTSSGVQNKTFWTKKGVIRLGFFVKSEKAKQFRDWAEDLILKGLERPVDKMESLAQHTKRDVQVQNSKGVNSYLFQNWDRETLIEYNRRNCQLVSGYLPSDLKRIGKANGLKSTQYSSGKEVLRNLKPELAAQMSLNDDLVQSGVKLTEANSLSAPCLPLLSKMVQLKMIR
jgi:Prophage antirepressor